MEDPLLRYSPFREHSSLYIRHAHEVLISFMMYHMLVYSMLAPVANRTIFRRHYKDASKAVRMNFDVHTASMFQAVVCLILSFPLLWLPVGLDLFEYSNEYASMVSAVTLGYFLWDLYLCVRYFRLFGLGFLVHAVGSVAVTGLSLMPSFQAWIGKFLIFEVSTPFVNVNWYIAQLTRKTSSRPVVPAWVNVLNGILLLLTFFVVRIVWGTVALAILDYQVWKQWDVNTPVIVALIVPTINWLMTILNYYWFSKMVRIARKMANASKKVSKVA